MKIASLVFGIISVALMLIGFIPCFGALNWINIPFAGIGFVISVVALTQNKEGEPKSKAIAGIVLCGFAMLFGLIRLLIGGGLV